MIMTHIQMLDDIHAHISIIANFFMHDRDSLNYAYFLSRNMLPLSLFL